MSYCVCGGYLGSGGADGIAGIRWCRCASPKMANLVTQTSSGISVKSYNKELVRKEINNMNLKEIKDAARKAFSDQQTQDTEGGVPDAVSFIAGFLAGARHLQSAFDDRCRVIEMQLEDKKKLEFENQRLREIVSFFESGKVNNE